MIALDASALIDLLRNGPNSGRIAALVDDDVVAPELLIPETLRFLARRTHAGDDVEPARRAFAEMDIEYVATWPYLDRMWELRHAVSSYDAVYVAVAEARGCPLVTSDARLARAPGLRADVVLA